MVTQLIREVLKSLCCNNGWSYGVFWRVNRRNCMLLTLEDAYYEENIRIVIEKMFQQAHMMGEGIIGQAAFMGKNRWMFSDTYGGNMDSLGSINNLDVFKDNFEFHRQFSSGIETIAVISVAPLGVIQFGSTQKILERLEFVDQIKSLFRQLGSIDRLHLLGNTPSSLNGEIYDPSRLLASVVDLGNSYSHCGTASVYDESCKDLNRRAQSATVLSQPSPFTLSLQNPGVSPSMNSSLLHHKHQFQIAGAEAQVILSTPNLESPQNLSVATLANNSVAKNPFMSVWNNGSSSLTSFEQQLLSGIGMQGPPSTFPANTNTIVPCGNTFQNFQEDSVITSLHGTSGSLSTVDNARSLEGDRPTGYSLGNLVDVQLPVSSFNTTEGGSPKGSASFDKFPGGFGPTNAAKDSSIRNQVSSDVPSGLLAGDIFDGITVNCSAPSMQNSVCTIDSLSVCDDREKSLGFATQLPNDNCLFDSLGLDLGCILEKDCWDDILMPESNGSHSILSTGISGCISNLDVGSSIGSQTGFFSDFGVENLFDDIVGKTVSDTKPSSEDQLSTTVTRTGSTSAFSNQVQSTSISCLGGSVDALPPKCNPEKIEKTDVHLTHKDNLLRSQLGAWVEDSYSINSGSAVTTKSKESGQAGKVSRKRARPGESTRPRPKDRQQIQDRVKELREIVPNGAKCSIDSLLDRTIKHMLFLQGVTKYSDTLKQAYEPKIISEESGIVLKDNSSGGCGGATWAFQVGGKTMVCPILVEDVSPLGQMLVEMLCEERGFFLEIADKIRGFGLTILKGVMEVRDDKVWARFVVEANRDVTRMDIFLSLVQLLQQTETSGTSTLNQPTEVVDRILPHLKDYQQNMLCQSQSA